MSGDFDASDRPEQAPGRALLPLHQYHLTLSLKHLLLRPTALLKPHHPPKIAQLPTLDARKFTVTTGRPFLDECLSQTHTLISGIHGMTGLPWAATIPLFTFLVRIFLHLPLSTYCYKLDVKRLELYKESRIAVEDNARPDDREKSPQERQRIKDKAVNLLWRRMVKQNKVQYWKAYFLYLNMPIWVTIMETIRRMTGTEDGMLSLIAKPLTAQQGKQDLEPVTIMDELVPIEPSLATEGMLWFDNLMIPDPLSILPFVLSGFVYLMYSARKGIIDFQLPPGSTLELSIFV